MIEQLKEAFSQTIAELKARVARLERLSQPATNGTGPFVLKVGNNTPGGGDMTGQLKIAPASGITGGLLVLDSPGSDNAKYIFKFENMNGDLITLSEAGTWLSNINAIFATDRGIVSNSSGAQIIFPAGGAQPGNINIDSSTSGGTVKGISFLTPIGNGIVWSYDGVDGTARTVVPDATDDVVYVLTGLFVIRDSAGNIAAGTIPATAPGGTFNLFDDGGTNTCQLQISAGGAVTVQRTAGSRTYKVALSLLWL